MNNEPIKGCQGPCGSIDCSHGCIDNKPWTGSKADSNEMIDWIAKNTARDTPQQPQPMATYVQGQEYTGGSVSYYQVKVTSPTSGADAYTAECNDIIEALGMNYAEGNAFKAIWRRCAARNLGLSKRGYTDGLYDAEKVVFFGQRMVAQEKSK